MDKSDTLIVTSEFPPQPGGIGNHAFNLALQLSKNGYEVRVIADQRSSDGKEEDLFDSTLPFKVFRTKVNSPRIIMYVKRIVDTLKLVKRSHQIIATGKFSLWSVALSSLLHKRSYVAVVHGTEVNFKSFLPKYAVNASLKRFSTLIAVSNYTRRLISHIKIPSVIISNGFDSGKWNNLDGSYSSGLIGHPKLITVGNVTHRKGQRNVIAHLPKLILTYPDIHYHCVGLKTESGSFLKLAKELNVDSHITFHGRVSDSRLKGMLEESDIFVMLSTETKTGDVEGFGIAILEANALGIPAIGAKGCGIEDAINDGLSGILVNATDQNEFQEAIRLILGQPESFQSGALEFAFKHRWEDIIKQYILVLNDLKVNF